MNLHKTFTIFLTALAGFQIAAMHQPDLRKRLINAAEVGNAERVEQLMLAGISVDPEALFYSTVWGRYDVVKTIFECGVDPESPADPNQVYNGAPILESLLRSFGTMEPHVKEKLTRLYIKHGVDLDRIASPIALVRPTEDNTIELLLEHGVDVNARDFWTRTALMNLAWHLIPKSVLKDEEMSSLHRQMLKRSAELLIKHGADVNLKDKKGETSLILAARQGNRPLVELLLENDANVNLKNLYGQSALDYAEGKPEILELLKNAQKTSSEKT